MAESVALIVPERLGTMALSEVDVLADRLTEWAPDATIDEAIEALARAAALEEYFAKRDLAGPLQTAERSLERRIGDLLGPAEVGRPTNGNLARAQSLEARRRHEFRLIAEQWAAVEKALPCSRAEALRRAKKAKKEKDAQPPADCTLEQWSVLSRVDQERLLTFDGAETFNRQQSSTADQDQSVGDIEWAQWSWNPITGCLHNCPYCYARDIANRFYAEGFQPVLRPRRLTAPANTTVPRETGDPVHDMGNRNVFTCSMADLFGRWVPQEWIEAVLDRVRANPQWNFLFLTKFPVRLAEFEFPDNAWVGTTVDAQARVRNAERSFRKVRAPVRWLSVEPLLEPLQFDDLGAFQWIVLGGASASTRTPEWHPPRQWSDDLRRQAEKLGIPVYEKRNLLRRIRQYPGWDIGDEGAADAELPSSLRYLARAESAV